MPDLPALTTVARVQPRLVSFLGLIVFLALAWACSLDRKRFPWRTVLAGLLLQFLFAILILKTRFGAKIFFLAQMAIEKLNVAANEGARMVFGPLADQPFLTTKWGPENAVIFAILVTATIILVAALSALFYHWGLLQKVVHGMAWVMRRLMGTSGSESLAAAANIFMGQTEAPLVVKPYLSLMTRSELLAVMTGGMASIAGGVAAVYAALGAEAGHLLSASVMSAPASLMISKIMLPETERSASADVAKVAEDRSATNSLDALCRGASDGMMLSLNVIAMLIGFVAVVALANMALVSGQKWFQVAEPVTLQTCIGWLNAPFAWLMGVPGSDCVLVGRALGERIVLNEFIGYLTLTNSHKAGQILAERSFVLGTYALCGFANFTSIAIQIGGIGALVPERRADLARLGLRAMVAGLLSCYLMAAVVGILL